LFGFAKKEWNGMECGGTHSIQYNPLSQIFIPPNLGYIQWNGIHKYYNDNYAPAFSISSTVVPPFFVFFSSYVHYVFFLLAFPILHTTFPFCFPHAYLLPQRNRLANYYATIVNYIGTIVMHCTFIFNSN